MARSRSRRLLVRHVADATDATATGRRGPDELIVEEPLTIVVNGVVVATTMRTPGNDFELAAGFCWSEGLLVDDEIRSIRYCGDGVSASDNEFNRVEVLTVAGTAPTERLVTTGSSCGWCGSTQIDEMVARIAPLAATMAPPPSMLLEVVRSVRSVQPLFAATGAAHAAARFAPDGTVGEVREDVGRHNAVDKIVGWGVVRDDRPGPGDGLYVSGRASVEMVHKAWAGGFTTLVAVSAPTALAVDAARRAGLHLIGFVRGEAMNIYSPERPEPARESGHRVAGHRPV